MNEETANYTADAQASLDAARQEALARRSAHVEPEHLLMALLTPASGTVWSLLVGILGDPRPLRKQMDAALSAIPVGAGDVSPVVSFRTERALSDAGEVAQQAGTPIDTPHLLLGVLDEGGAASTLLRQAGLDARQLRHWLRQKPRGGRFVPAPEAVSKKLSPKKLSPKKPSLEHLPLRQALPRLIDWRAVFVLVAMLGVGGWLATRSENETAGVVIFVLGGWVFSVSAHEFGHALAADLGGDRSVRDKGYLSFNPLVYTHVLLSIVMPVLFLLIGGIGLPGGAVYIERHRLRSSGWNAIVSAAGPIASLMVAFIMSLPFLLRIVDFRMIVSQPGLWGALSLLVTLNISAVLFNLLPIPPLDGFGVIAPWLPPDLRDRLYSLGFLGLWLIILAFLYFDPLSELFWTTVYDIGRSVGIDPVLAYDGLTRFMFWR